MQTYKNINFYSILGIVSANFRLLQILSVMSSLLFWVIKMISSPRHLHMTMLISTVIILLVSEISYRAGKV